jgi:dipeptidase
MFRYASEGESFSIGDPHELWVLEMIGKGKGELGAVWVAQRIPDNSICAHANQARIRQFDQSGTSKDVFFAPDVISFARKMKLYSGNDEDFSFSDVYDPLTVTGARFCEARVYSFFSAWMGQDFQDEYLGYVQGRNLTNRMPLYVTVPDDRKIGLRDLMHNFQNHYENTWFDMRSDFGAEPFESGYRCVDSKYVCVCE